MKIVVAGSGPAGVFAALGALEAGHEVTMIDPAHMLDKPRAKEMAALAKTPARAWSAQQREAVMRGTTLSKKRLFGDAFATDDNSQIVQRGCELLTSRAKGGLSNLWGRGIEPPPAGELVGLDAAIAHVLTQIPFAGEDDALTNIFPLHGTPKPHALTRASRALHARWQKRAEHFAAQGIYGGATRLALDVKACQRCGMCFAGCVYGAMWSSDQLLARFGERFTYRAGVALERFESNTQGVALQTSAGEMKAERLLLACGAVESTRIVMHSLGLKQGQLKTSELLKFVFLRIGKAVPIETEFHALSQLTLALRGVAKLKKTAVIHLFGQNPLLNLPFASRIYIGMAFLHSDDSRKIALSLEGNALLCEGVRAVAPWKSLLLLWWKLFKSGLALGLIPIPIGVAKSGASVHVGASLPVDVAQNVKVVDAASLPEIPAGSYTLSLMAHAYLCGR